MKRQLFAGLLLVSALVLVGLIVSGETTRAQGQDEEIRASVVEYLEARWNLLVNPNLPLEGLYDQKGTGPAMAMAERQRFERHYLEPARKDGIWYTSVKVLPQFKRVEVNGNTARVLVIVDVEYVSLDVQYESVNPAKPWPIVTKEAGLEHDIHLVRRDGQWVIAGDQYFDTFSKRGTSNDGVGEISTYTNCRAVRGWHLVVAFL